MLWFLANGTWGNPENFHYGIFLGLWLLPGRNARHPARYAETISIQNQHLAPARSTWRSLNVRAHEIGADNNYNGLFVSALPQEAGKESIERRYVTSEHVSARHSREVEQTCYETETVGPLPG